MVGYIDQVPPQGGGFTVWPGSHHIFYYDFKTRYTFNPLDKLQGDMAQVSQQTYIDCHGDAGDIIFWHHRLGHSVGHNLSQRIRQAVLYDFSHKDLEQIQDSPPNEDMWQDWAV